QDKFSGYDRVEGGTRANVGFRYSASYDNGAVFDLMAGQSFQIAGQNSFAQRDLVNAGLESGLETKHSDYVVSSGLDTGQGLAVAVGGRFDESDLAFKRGEVSARYAGSRVALNGNYVYIANQPAYAAYNVSGITADRHEANASASIKLTDYWRAFGAASFDIEQGNLYSRKIGVAYDDSCFSFSVAYQEVENRYTGASTENSLFFRVGLRTIGDYNYKYSLSDDDPQQQN
ncbi:MAG: LPS assembly protein LptD, partial [Rhizobiaceae bacterium]